MSKINSALTLLALSLMVSAKSSDAQTPHELIGTWCFSGNGGFGSGPESLFDSRSYYQTAENTFVFLAPSSVERLGRLPENVSTLTLNADGSFSTLHIQYQLMPTDAVHKDFSFSLSGQWLLNDTILELTLVAGANETLNIPYREGLTSATFYFSYVISGSQLRLTPVNTQPHLYQTMLGMLASYKNGKLDGINQLAALLVAPYSQLSAYSVYKVNLAVNELISGKNVSHNKAFIRQIIEAWNNGEPGLTPRPIKKQMPKQVVHSNVVGRWYFDSFDTFASVVYMVVPSEGYSSITLSRQKPKSKKNEKYLELRADGGFSLFQNNTCNDPSQECWREEHGEWRLEGDKLALQFCCHKVMYKGELYDTKQNSYASPFVELKNGDLCISGNPYPDNTKRHLYKVLDCFAEAKEAGSPVVQIPRLMSCNSASTMLAVRQKEVHDYIARISYNGNNLEEEVEWLRNAIDSYISTILVE